MSATDSSDVWAKLAAPLPVSAISWRQDGKPTQRDGKYSARCVAYIEAGTVRERLDSVVPGEWDLTLELLPQQTDEDGAPMVGFKARIEINSVNVASARRECVGQGKDYKSAATDAFKRAAVRFGIGHELYQMEQLWVPVDSDSKYAKPLEDPASVYARKLGKETVGVSTQQRRTPASSGADRTVSVPASTTPSASQPDPLTSDEPSCPKCGGRMWDNRLSKRNSKAPDFKCRSRSCDGVIWPEKPRAATSDPLWDDAPPFDDADPVPF